MYSNNKEFIIDTVDAFVNRISDILMLEYLKEGYILDIADAEKRLVFLQIIHPMYIEGYGTSYKVGIHLGVEDEERNHNDLEVLSSINMDKVGEDNGVDTYYKVYELSEKSEFENGLKQLLLNFYQYAPNHKFMFSFQNID